MNKRVATLATYPEYRRGHSRSLGCVAGPGAGLSLAAARQSCSGPARGFGVLALAPSGLRAPAG